MIELSTHGVMGRSDVSMSPLMNCSTSSTRLFTLVAVTVELLVNGIKVLGNGITFYISFPTKWTRIFAVALVCQAVNPDHLNLERGGKNIWDPH